jgi:hypothetical protein
MKTIRPVNDPTAPALGRVNAGDTVVVYTRDNRRLRFVVQAISHPGDWRGLRRLSKGDLGHE